MPVISPQEIQRNGWKNLQLICLDEKEVILNFDDFKSDKTLLNTVAYWIQEFGHGFTIHLHNVDALSNEIKSTIISAFKKNLTVNKIYINGSFYWERFVSNKTDKRAQRLEERKKKRARYDSDDDGNEDDFSEVNAKASVSKKAKLNTTEEASNSSDDSVSTILNSAEAKSPMPEIPVALDHPEIDPMLWDNELDNDVAPELELDMLLDSSQETIPLPSIQEGKYQRIEQAKYYLDLTRNIRRLTAENQGLINQLVQSYGGINNYIQQEQSILNDNVMPKSFAGFTFFSNHAGKQFQTEAEELQVENARLMQINNLLGIKVTNLIQQQNRLVAPHIEQNAPTPEEIEQFVESCFSTAGPQL